MRSVFIRFFILLGCLFPALTWAATSINLAKGWNLVGNSDSTSIDVASALGDASKVTTVWKWNATASTWAFYAPSMTTSDLATYAAGKGYDVLSSIAPKQGFWVNAPAAGTLTGAVPNGVMLTEADLQVGWNLASSADNLTPSQLNAGLNTSLNGAGKAITTLWAWEPTASQWKFYAPSLEAQGAAILSNYIAPKGYLPFTVALSASDGYWMNIAGVVPTPNATPVTPAYRLATATSHSCVITAAGAVKCWGLNGAGELGDGTNFPHLTPVNVLGLNSNVVALSAQNFRTCALTSTGGVKCWGNNDNGALGDGTEVFRRSPVDVLGLSSGVVQVSVGLFTTCALMKTGGVKCWGYNATGALGDGTTQKRLTPVDVVGLGSGVVAISSADRNCALTVSGGVKCWGSNIFGQIGDGTTVDRLTPVDVVGLSSGVMAISAGAYHTCAIMNGGGVKCWGTNAQGELGDGTTLLRLAPVDVVGLGSGVASLAELEERMTCAVMSAGGAKCWGMNNVGQLGDGTKQNRLIPTDVVGLSSGVAAVSAGPYHSCALTTAGGVKCWGQNAYGQLGDGSTVYSSTPVDVVGF